MPSLLDKLDIATGHTITVQNEFGHITAVLSYVWVKDFNDMIAADAGFTPEGGNVLYICNVFTEPGNKMALWELRKKLPKHRWIVGLTEDFKVKAPKGVPESFYENN